jgi:hypothetical protein
MKMALFARRRIVTWVIITVTALLVRPAGLLDAAITVPVCSAQQVTFNATGAVQQRQVPAAVTQVTIGAAGGSGTANGAGE